MLKRVVIKEELVELTKDFRKAIILNQFIYWSERTKDTDKWLKEEKVRASKDGIVIDVLESNGWIYKSAEELGEEIMLGLNIKTLRKLLKELISDGYIQERRNPKYKWDKTMQYRVDLVKVQSELFAMGYNLEGFKLLDNRLMQEKEKAPTCEVEDVNKNSTCTNSICNNNTNNTSNKEKNKDVKTVNEVIEILENNEIKNVNKKEACKIFTDIDKLIKSIDKCGAIKQYKYLIEVYNTPFRNAAEYKSNKKGFNSYEGSWVNDVDLDEKIEMSQKNKYSQPIIEHNCFK